MEAPNDSPHVLNRSEPDLQALYAAIVASSEDAIISKTLDGVIRTWNRAAEEMFDIPAAEAIGSQISRIIPPECLADEARILQRLAGGERVASFETVRLKGDGSRFAVSLTISPVTDRYGRVVAASKIVRDITERRRLEQELSEDQLRVRMLADSIPQLAWMADVQGWIFWYNQRWFDFTGTTLDDMEGWGWTKVHHPDHVDRVVERIQRSWASGEPWEDTFPLRRHDGEYRWFLSRALPIRDHQGTVVRWFGTNTDVTERLALEEKLRRTTVELGDENRRKDHFLAALSHELRNPLSAIRSALAVLGSGVSATEVRARAAMVGDRSVQHIIRLLDDLRDIGRIGRGELEIQCDAVSLRAILEEALESTRPRFEAANIMVNTLLPPSTLCLAGDHARLVQVFGNLLANASKYTLPGGTVSLSAVVTSSRAQVTVSDNGIGIPPEQLNEIFGLFAQVESARAYAQNGLGLGLAIVRRIVTRHGGTVFARSDGAGCGSDFVVELPL